MHLGRARRLDCLQRALEGGFVLTGEADDHVRGQVEALGEGDPAQVRGSVVAARHRAQDAVVAGLERNVKMAGDGRRLAKRVEERCGEVVDLDRRQSEPCETGRHADVADQPRQVVALLAVPVAAEVDPGEHDLAVTLGDAAAHLGEHGIGGPAARCAAHERDHAEVAGEAAAVLHLHEGTNAVESGFALDTRDRTDIAGDRVGGLLASLRHDDDVLRQPGKGVGREVGAAPGDVHPPVGARRTRCGVPRLPERLVRHAARVQHGDVAAQALLVPVAQQTLAHRLGVSVRDLAAEEVDRESRHPRGPYCVRTSRSATHPSASRRSSRR